MYLNIYILVTCGNVSQKLCNNLVIIVVSLNTSYRLSFLQYYTTISLQYQNQPIPTRKHKVVSNDGIVTVDVLLAMQDNTAIDGNTDTSKINLFHQTLRLKEISMRMKYMAFKLKLHIIIMKDVTSSNLSKSESLNNVSKIIIPTLEVVSDLMYELSIFLTPIHVKNPHIVNVQQRREQDILLLGVNVPTA